MKEMKKNRTEVEGPEVAGDILVVLGSSEDEHLAPDDGGTVLHPNRGLGRGGREELLPSEGAEVEGPDVVEVDGASHVHTNTAVDDNRA